ncbi:DUF6261 family protein [Capnocytophaga stomatis]|uniref:DUF6261 family protein n=1 Tax=Capnocytophaga stomatis TaxID=1848904 RepID=UPI00194F59FE|nr:DUF6261 family protein [Capnocytophaga stomatis]
MIRNFNLGRIPQMAFLAHMTNVKNHLAKEDATSLGLEAVQSEFITALEEFEEALKPLQKSMLTEKIEEADNQRDKILVNFTQHCRTFVFFPEAEKSNSAKELLAEIDKFGKAPQDKPRAEQTAIINSLLKDLDTPTHKQNLNNIWATEWVKYLTQTNTEFEKLYNERTYETSGTEPGLAKKLRVKTYDSFKKLVQYINALATINGIEKYKNLIDNINKEIEQVR